MSTSTSHCSVGGAYSSSFDNRVDRCYIIYDIGKVRKVPVSGVIKDVYNIYLLNDLYNSMSKNRRDQQRVAATPTI